MEDVIIQTANPATKTDALVIRRLDAMAVLLFLRREASMPTSLVPAVNPREHRSIDGIKALVDRTPLLGSARPSQDPGHRWLPSPRIAFERLQLPWRREARPRYES